VAVLMVNTILRTAVKMYFTSMAHWTGLEESGTAFG
jgi:hypothetical protein